MPVETLCGGSVTEVNQVLLAFNEIAPFETPSGFLSTVADTFT